MPDFIVQVDDGRPDPLNLIVEIKGFRGENAKEKANTMRAYWVPGVNNLGNSAAGLSRSSPRSTRSRRSLTGSSPPVVFAPRQLDADDAPFEEQVLRKRPISSATVSQVIEAPLRREAQGDGRIRFWGEILRPSETAARVLRVITLEDGETVHNAFFDRGFRKDEP